MNKLTLILCLLLANSAFSASNFFQKMWYVQYVPKDSVSTPNVPAHHVIKMVGSGSAITSPTDHTDALVTANPGWVTYVARDKDGDNTPTEVFTNNPALPSATATNFQKYFPSAFGYHPRGRTFVAWGIEADCTTKVVTYKIRYFPNSSDAATFYASSDIKNKVYSDGILTLTTGFISLHSASVDGTDFVDAAALKLVFLQGTVTNATKAACPP